MSEEMQHEDALEQRLRAHYASKLGQPPSPATVWTSLQEKLASSSQGEANSTPAPHQRRAAARPAPAFPPIPHETHALRLRSVLSIVAAGLVIALFATVLLHPFGRTGGKSTATKVPDESLPAGFTVHVLAPDEVWPGTVLNDVQMLSADEGWGVGYHFTSTSSRSVILHYTHGRWSASPDVFLNVMLGNISMISPTEGWASGAIGSGESSPQVAVLLHYSGGHWRSVQAPGNGTMGSLAMLTPRDGWAIQIAPLVLNSPIHTSLLHYDGTAWSIVDTSGISPSLVNLAMLSPTEGWAAGLDGIIAHFHNGTWTRWPTKAPGRVSGITMVSPTEGWMSGVAPGNSTNPMDQKSPQSVVLHYNGHSWQSVTLPELPNLLHVYPNATNYQNSGTTNAIGAISMASSAEGWAAGTLAGGFATILCHYSGGKWHLYPYGVNAGLTMIQMVSASEGWAIGTKYNDDTGVVDSTILHYTQGSWTVYKP